MPDDFLEAARIDGLNEFQDLVARRDALGGPCPIGAGDLCVPWQLDGLLLAVNRHHLARALYPSDRPSAVEQAIKWEMIMTGAALATIPTLIVFLVLQRYIVRGVMLAGLKG